jgi:hypothetical protein
VFYYNKILALSTKYSSYPSSRRKKEEIRMCCHLWEYGKSAAPVRKRQKSVLLLIPNDE